MGLHVYSNVQFCSLRDHGHGWQGLYSIPQVVSSFTLQEKKKYEKRQKKGQSLLDLKKIICIKNYEVIFIFYFQGFMQ